MQFVLEKSCAHAGQHTAGGTANMDGRRTSAGQHLVCGKVHTHPTPYSVPCVLAALPLLSSLAAPYCALSVSQHRVALPHAHARRLDA